MVRFLLLFFIINPCQNRPTGRSECKTLVWSYNMKEHYRISHPEIQTCSHEISRNEIRRNLESFTIIMLNFCSFLNQILFIYFSINIIEFYYSKTNLYSI